jgi:hypothetical protein
MNPWQKFLAQHSDFITKYLQQVYPGAKITRNNVLQVARGMYNYMKQQAFYNRVKNY